MRLGQFARKLDVKPSEIADFLNSEHGQEISVHPNSKIPEAFLDLVKDKFSPQSIQKESEQSELSTTNVSVEKAPESEIEMSTPVEEVNIQKDETETETNDAVISSPDVEIEVTNSLEEASNDETSPLKEWQRGEFVPDELKEQAETIKAPKIDLEGLKVVGKIDLPEKPVAEPQTDTELKEKRSNKKSKQNVRNGKRKYTKEEREAFAAKKKQKAHEKRVKEQEEQRRKAHYEKILEAQKNNPKKKKKVKKVSENHQNQKKKEKKPEPTTLWGKFKRWLNDE